MTNVFFSVNSHAVADATRIILDNRHRGQKNHGYSQYVATRRRNKRCREQATLDTHGIIVVALGTLFVSGWSLKIWSGFVDVIACRFVAAHNAVCVWVVIQTWRILAANKTQIVHKRTQNGTFFWKWWNKRPVRNLTIIISISCGVSRALKQAWNKVKQASFRFQVSGLRLKILSQTDLDPKMA